jgi:krueppel-like factor 5
MHRLNKLDTDVELDLLHQRSAINHSNSMGYQCDSYSPSKDFHYDTTKKDHHHQDSDDAFMRPPLWEDITSSIQNIDPENAIMLNALTGATQVKLESCDETTFLESLSSPLLSPLEIKTEKDFYHQQQQNQLPPSSHNNMANADYHQQYHHQQLNGYQDFNLHPQHLPGQQQYSNNYYNNWQQPTHHPQQQQQQPQSQSHQTTIYNNNKYPSSQSTNFSAPISRLMYVPPLTPPTSDPGSPGNNIQVSF